MQIQRPGTDDVRFEMTAMMDIIFQLIAFFMIVSTFIALEKVEVDLPLAPHAGLAENQSGRLMVALTVDGTIWLGAEVVTLEELAAGVEAWRVDQPRARVVIRSDRAAPYATVKAVMKTCRDAGLSDIIFASYQSGP